MRLPDSYDLDLPTGRYFMEIESDRDWVVTVSHGEGGLPPGSLPQLDSRGPNLA